jgi:hypothetical protein
MNMNDDRCAPGTLELRGDRRRIDVWFGCALAIIGIVAWRAPGLFDLPTMPVDIVGAILAISGLAVVFFRSGVVINSEARTVTRWWGFPMPVFRTTDAISPMAVRLRHRISHSDGASWSRYPIFIVSWGDQCRSDANEIEVTFRYQPMAAWIVAQDIARFLDVQLLDESEEAVYEFPGVSKLTERRRRKARALSAQ